MAHWRDNSPNIHSYESFRAEFNLISMPQREKNIMWSL